MHFFEQLFHAEEGWVSATSENMSLHVDMDAGRTAPFPDAIAKALARTLDLPMHLIPNGCHCVGLRLVIGTNALNRRYSQLENRAPQHMLSATATSLDFGLAGLQRW